MSVEHLYHGFEAPKKLIKEATSKQVWKVAAQFMERMKLLCRRALPGGMDRDPLKEKQGLGTRCNTAGVEVGMGESRSPVC